MTTMNNTIPSNGDDVVTIPEALKRLGNQAPTRQSLYTAVNKGKIREVTDKENPKATRMISWAGVLDYVAKGGFKSRRNSGTADDGVTKATPPMAGNQVPDSPHEPITVASGLADLSTPAIPTKPQAVNQGGNTSTSTQATPSREQVPGNSCGKRKPALPRERVNPKPDKKTAPGENSKGRRNLPLRVIKNNLRHLDYEQTKSIRDWADNRLLTVLRPDSSTVSDDSKTKTPQPA